MKTLSVKGVREKSLLDNLKKIYPSKLNLHISKDIETKVPTKDFKLNNLNKSAGRYTYDNPSLSKDEVSSLIMQESFNYVNTSDEHYIEKQVIKSEEEELKKMIEDLFLIEVKITTFLQHIDKEWDNKENRDIWVIILD